MISLAAQRGNCAFKHASDKHASDVGALFGLQGALADVGTAGKIVLSVFSSVRKMLEGIDDERKQSKET